MAIGWFVVMNLVQPRLMAEVVGIPPIVVFASVLIGSKVAGVAGAIFGLPIAAVISAVFMFGLQRSMTDQGSVAVRAARRLEAREGRPSGSRGSPTRRPTRRRSEPGDPGPGRAARASSSRTTTASSRAASWRWLRRWRRSARSS